MRVKELEEVVRRYIKQQYKQLEERRRLEAEGFRSELAADAQGAAARRAAPPRPAHAARRARRGGDARRRRRRRGFSSPTLSWPPRRKHLAAVRAPLPRLKRARREPARNFDS